MEMMSQSLFDTMEEFSMQENYLDEAFGLSADVLAADLNTEGSILDVGLGLGPNEGLKHSTEQLSIQESLEDLLLPEPTGDFGDAWMENVDLNSLLENSIVKEEPVSVPVVVPAIQKVEIEVEQPKREGLKASAFELLKALLTGNAKDIAINLQPASPEAQVPEVPFTDSLIDASATDFVFEPVQTEAVSTSLEDLIDIKTDVVPSNSEDIVEVQPVINLAETASTSSSQTDFVNMSSSFGTDDIESLLSSGPSSPDDTSVTFHTIDSSQLSGPSSVVSDDSFTDEVEFTKIKTKSKSGKGKSRSKPYEVDPIYLDKKDRKKVQNKNAATRYRVKKREEKMTLQQQEAQLADKNKQLREKVESLQREISYMKDLMNEIYKAKANKI